MAGFFTRLKEKFISRPKIDWDELESDLITADLGVRRAMSIVESLRERKDVKAEDIVEETRSVILSAFPETPLDWEKKSADKTTVILVVGVNGTGKTTSAAKLAHWLQGQGKSVLLAAADTFRAAAVEQIGRAHV